MSPRSPSVSTSLSRIAWVTRTLSALCYVWQQPELARALDRDRELALVAPAGAGDPGRADLALLAHRAAQRAEVLVVDDVDLVPAELARLAPAAAGWALLVTPARRLPATL